MRVKKSVVALAAGLVLAGLTGCGSVAMTARRSRSTTPSTRSCSTSIVPGLHRGDRHRGRAAQRRATSSWPTSSSRRARRSPGRRLPHRELAGDVARRQRRACSRQLDDETLAQVPAQYVPGERQLDGVRRPLDGAGLQHRQGRARPSCRLDHGPRRSRSGRAGSRSRPTGADFQAIVSAVLELKGEEATGTGSRASRPTAGLRGQQRRHEVGQRRRDRRRRDLPLLLVPRPGGVRRQQPTLASCTSSATRTRVRSSASPAPACSSRATSRTTPSSSSQYLTSVEGQQVARRQLRAGVPAQPRGPARHGGQAVRRAGAAAGRHLRAQRPEGHRADAGRRAALSTTQPTARRQRGGRLERSAHRSWLLLAGGCGVAALRADPARLRRRLHRRRSGSDEALASCWSGRGSASCCSTPSGWSSAAWLLSVVARRRLRLAGRAHRPAVPPRLARPARGAARRPGVRQQLRLGLADPRRRGVRRRGADRDAVVLPARLPAGGGALRGLDPALEEAALLPGPQPVADVLRGSCCRSCGRRCSAARCSSGCTCWRSSGRCRCCGSRRSPPRSTTSTGRRSTARRPTCSPACSCCAACVLLLAELRLRGHQALRPGRRAAPPGSPPRRRLGPADRAGPAALAGAGRAGARRAARQPRALAAWSARSTAFPSASSSAAASTSLGLGAGRRRR